MSLTGYGVLVGRAVAGKAEPGSQSPHYQVLVHAAGIDYRIAVNVRSAQSPPDLLYIADETFDHPIVTTLADLVEDFHPMPSRPGGDALDYIRGNLFDHTTMRTLPGTQPRTRQRPVRPARALRRAGDRRPDARLYAFGQRWGPEDDTPDKIFGFAPGNGVHDIHMNQGNGGRFASDDGVWQDGGLLLHFPTENQWVAIFLAFQSQAWHTDDTTGHPVGGEPGPTPQPPDSGTDHHVRIVGALVNPIGPAPEAESVTLLNATPDDVDLTGWALLDRIKERMTLTGPILKAGDAIRIPIEAPVQLGNQGGLITVLDDTGLKVDGVAYTEDQTRNEGWTLTF